MAVYEVGFRRSVARDLRRLPRQDLTRILKRIQQLTDNPRPAGVEKLSAQEKYRIRQGVYRILYEIRDAELIVIVVKVAHRKHVYKVLKQ